MRRLASRIGGLLSVLLCAATARADLPPQVSIRWSGSSCPRPLGLEAEVSKLLGEKRPAIERTEFEVEVDEEDGGYELTLDVDGEHQRAERSVQLASCAEAQDAAALLIATAIDPDAVLRAPPPPPPPPPPPKPPEPEAPRAPLQRWSALMGGALDGFALPGVSGGPLLGGLWQGDREILRAWLQLRYLAPRTASGPDVQTRVDLFSAALGGARVWAYGPVSFGPAVEVESGLLRARASRGPMLSGRESGTAWGCVYVGALAAYGVSRRVGLELGVFAGVPLRRPSLAVRDEATFYETSPVTMRLALAARVSLGSP